MQKRQITPTEIPEQPDWGFDRTDFWSLAGRLLPCGPGQMMISIDLRQRLWFWSPEDRLWYAVPDGELRQLMSQVDAWRSIASEAVRLLAMFLSKGADDSRGSAAFESFQAIQFTFLRSQKIGCAWQNAWLYRSLCLDHKWLLGRTWTPSFDEYVYSMLIMEPLGGVLSEDTRSALRNDPITAAMPSLYDLVFPHSWKTRVISASRERGVFASLEDVHEVVTSLISTARFALEGATKLLRSDAPLGGEGAVVIQQEIVDGSSRRCSTSLK